MIVIQWLLVSIFLIGFYFLIGRSVNTQFKLEYEGFEPLIGYVFIFGLFHVLSLIPLMTHGPVSIIYYGVYPLILITSIRFYLYPRTYKAPVNPFLIISTLIIISCYFIFDFIYASDSSFYLPLIRSTTKTDHLYQFNPWTNTPDGELSFIYYLVSYEAFIGTLSHLFKMDSTVFTLNVIPIVHLVVILHTLYTVLEKLFQKDKNRAFIWFVFIFVFLNSNLHGVPYSYNAFNFMANISSGKSIYLYGVLLFNYVLVNNLVKYHQKKDILLLGLINLVVPGLSASALFLQLMITMVLLVYFVIYEHQKKDLFYSQYGLIAFSPLFVHYALLIIGPEFYFSNPILKAVIMLLFFIILGLAWVLRWTNNYLIAYHSFIKQWFYKGLLLIGLITLVVGVIYGTNQLGIIMRFLKSLPPLTQMIKPIMSWMGYIILVTLGMLTIKQDKSHPYRFLLLTFPLLILLLFLNPFVFPFVATFITSVKTYHRTVYLLPTGFIIVYYLLKQSKPKQILIVLIIGLLSTPIFIGIEPMNKQTHFFYKSDRDLVKIGLKLSTRDQPAYVLGEQEVIETLPLITNHISLKLTSYQIRKIKYGYDENELITLYQMISGESFDSESFQSILIKYDFDYIIVREDNQVNDDLKELYSIDYSLSTGRYIVYDINT